MESEQQKKMREKETNCVAAIISLLEKSGEDQDTINEILERIMEKTINEFIKDVYVRVDDVAFKILNMVSVFNIEGYKKIETGSIIDVLGSNT